MTNNISTKATLLYTSMYTFVHTMFDTSFIWRGRQHSTLINTYTIPGSIYHDKTSFSFPAVCALNAWRHSAAYSFGIAYQSTHQEQIQGARAAIVCKRRHTRYTLHTDGKGRNIYII